MITTFICKTKDCPNKGVEYNFEGELVAVECGGCQTQLKAVPSA